jgi:hypothetical protein
MKQLLIIVLALVLLASCAPSMDMVVKPFNDEKEMPRFCFTERMLFYEISLTDSALQLWIYSNNRLTIDQLISKPLHIYFAEKKRKNTQYHLKYKDFANNKFVDKNEQGINLAFFNYKEKDTIDITANFNFEVATNYDGNEYDLKIKFPKSIINKFENPVMGIFSETPTPYKEKNKSATASANGAMENSARLDQPAQSHQYVREIKDIDLWFKVLLK